jgi:hypothetical protein
MDTALHGWHHMPRRDIAYVNKNSDADTLASLTDNPDAIMAGDADAARKAAYDRMLSSMKILKCEYRSEAASRCVSPETRARPRLGRSIKTKD